MPAFVAAWYLIYTKPRQENKVSAQLTNFDITTFLPASAVGTASKGKPRTGKPLFPSYLFVRPNDFKEYYKAMDVEGAVGYVKFGGNHAIVKDWEIENIRRIVERSNNIDVVTTYFQVGEMVKISKGPLEGILGEVIEFCGKQKVLVRVNILNRSILVDLSVKAVGCIA